MSTKLRLQWFTSIQFMIIKNWWIFIFAWKVNGGFSFINRNSVHMFTIYFVLFLIHPRIKFHLWLMKVTLPWFQILTEILEQLLVPFLITPINWLHNHLLLHLHCKMFKWRTLALHVNPEQQISKFFVFRN